MRNLKLTTPKTRILAGLATALVTLTASVAHAQYTNIWSDGYDVSANSVDVDFEYTTRQSGVLSPISYAQSPGSGDGFNWQSQVGYLGINNLLLIGGGPGGDTLVSPNHNFNSLPAGNTSMKVSFSLAMATTTGYTTTGFSLGSSSTLTSFDAGASHFGIRFIGSGVNIIQLFDGNTWSGNYNSPVAFGPTALDVTLIITDASDGNPWNGVGSTDISMYVNGNFVASYSKGGGGYTNNFMTMMALQSSAELGFNYFDALSVTTTRVPYPPVVVTPIALGAQSNVLQTLQIIGGKFAPTDANGDPLTVTQVTQGTNGAVTITGSGTNVTYRSNPGFAGTNDSFTYTVSDGDGGTATGIVNVTISPVVNQQTTSIAYNGTNVVVTFWGVPGYTYTVQSSTNLSTGIGWQDLTPTMTANNTNTQPLGRIMLTDTNSAASPSWFYRLKP